MQYCVEKNVIDVVTVWCMVWGMFAGVFAGTYATFSLFDLWRSKMNIFALIAWIVFIAITFGGLGLALWGPFGGTLLGLLGAVGSYLCTVKDPA